MRDRGGPGQKGRQALDPEEEEEGDDGNNAVMVMSMLVIVMVTGDDDKGVCTGRESFIGSLFPRRSPIGINPYLAVII